MTACLFYQLTKKLVSANDVFCGGRHSQPPAKDPVSVLSLGQYAIKAKLKVQRPSTGFILLSENFDVSAVDCISGIKVVTKE